MFRHIDRRGFVAAFAAISALLGLVAPASFASAQTPTPAPSSAPTAPQTEAALPAPSRSAAEPPPPVSTYRINPGDEIEIYVWGEERLQRQLRVLPDGSIAFPLVGQLKVAGMLPQDVERVVSTRLSSQYRGEVPVVTVSVRAPNGMQFSVMGKVKSPGSFTVGRYVNVLDALSLAGGPAEFANLGSVLVITRRSGKLQTFSLRLDGLFKSNPNGKDINDTNIISILPGDIVIVP